MQSVRKPLAFHWTNHSKGKMQFYRFSEQMIRRVIHSPARIKEGIVPDTVAFMQRAGSNAHPYEIWVMIQDKRNVRNVISAWRYPGRTKIGTPLPPEVVRALKLAIRI